jgi:ATP-dependent DNA helicase RecG
MERDLGYLQRGGSGRGTFWTLSRSLAKRLGTEKVHESTVRIDWESAKTRVLSVLKQRAADSEPGLQSGDIRGITHFDRNQVYRLMQELRQENPEIKCTGHGRGAWHAWIRD